MVDKENRKAHERYVDKLWSKFTRASAATAASIGAFYGAAALTINDDRVYEALTAKITDSVDTTGLMFFGVSIPYFTYCAKLVRDYLRSRNAAREAPVTAYRSRPAKLEVPAIRTSEMKETVVAAGKTQMPDTFERTELPSYLSGTNAELYMPLHQAKT